MSFEICLIQFDFKVKIDKFFWILFQVQSDKDLNLFYFYFFTFIQSI